MPGTHLRNESTEGGPLAKKLKSGHAAESSTSDAPFATGLLENANVERLQASYRESQPYRHVVVDKLFQEDLLSRVKDECINELSFTEKETDIYKASCATLISLHSHFLTAVLGTPNGRSSILVISFGRADSSPT